MNSIKEIWKKIVGIIAKTTKFAWWVMLLLTAFATVGYFCFHRIKVSDLVIGYIVSAVLLLLAIVLNSSKKKAVVVKKEAKTQLYMRLCIIGIVSMGISLCFFVVWLIASFVAMSFNPEVPFWIFFIIAVAFLIASIIVGRFGSTEDTAEEDDDDTADDDDDAADDDEDSDEDDDSDEDEDSDNDSSKMIRISKADLERIKANAYKRGQQSVKKQ